MTVKQWHGVLSNGLSAGAITIRYRINAGLMPENTEQLPEIRRIAIV